MVTVRTNSDIESKRKTAAQCLGGCLYVIGLNSDANKLGKGDGVNSRSEFMAERSEAEGPKDAQKLLR